MRQNSCGRNWKRKYIPQFISDNKLCRNITGRDLNISAIILLSFSCLLVFPKYSINGNKLKVLLKLNFYKVFWLPSSYSWIDLLKKTLPMERWQSIWVHSNQTRSLDMLKMVIIAQANNNYSGWTFFQCAWNNPFIALRRLMQCLWTQFVQSAAGS